MNVFESGHYLLGKNIKDLLCFFLKIAYAVDKGVSLSSLCVFMNSFYCLEYTIFMFFVYWAGASLQLRLMWGVFSNVNDFYLILMIFLCMSLHCKLLPVQY